MIFGDKWQTSKPWRMRRMRRRRRAFDVRILTSPIVHTLPPPPPRRFLELSALVYRWGERHPTTIV